jgi:hypothetical protein
MKIYCINLDHRLDRWQKIQQDFNQIYPIERFSAIKHREGWKGCILSHGKAAEKSIQESNDSIYCIIEDDCRPLIEKPLLSSKLEKYIHFLKSQDSKWDIFYGGGIYIIPTKIIHKFEDGSYMIECSWITCAHFLIHSLKSLKTVIEYGKKPEYEWKTGIDNYLAISHRERLWTIYPMLFDQYGSDTNIGNNPEYLLKINQEFSKTKDILKNFIIEKDKK